jgi:NAD+ synthase
MQAVQREIAEQLKVQPPFAGHQALEAEVARRITFIQDCLVNSGLKTLVLGISGGVDSLTAGLLAQRAMRELRERTGDNAYKFIAVRLPYETQFDEHDAQASVDFIAPDERHTVNIGPAVKSLASEVAAFEGKHAVSVDFVLGNTKARMRMVAQYTIAGAAHGLVIGTDHAAEAVMGFFTKFGDGACDLTPLTGLSKRRVRALAASLGADESLVYKVPTADLESLAPLKPDESAFGVSYDEIDDFLEGREISDEAAETILRQYRATAHKRALPVEPD